MTSETTKGRRDDKFDNQIQMLILKSKAFCLLVLNQLTFSVFVFAVILSYSWPVLVLNTMWATARACFAYLDTKGKI